MSTVFAGSDGSFLSSWQMYKMRNNEYERFVLASDDEAVFRRTDDSGTERYVLYVEIDEADLPEGVELSEDGHSVRDERSK